MYIVHSDQVEPWVNLKFGWVNLIIFYFNYLNIQDIYVKNIKAF